MKIVVLDRLPLDADHDLDWSPLASLGEVTLRDQTLARDTAARVAGANALYTNKVRLGAEEMEAAGPGLRFIGVLATGYDVVDIAEAKRRDITVCNVPSYSAAFTAQTTIALLLELCQQFGRHSDSVRTGDWQKRGIWSYRLTPQIELDGRTHVIVGLGTIGRRVAGIAAALGMRVIAAQLPGRPAPADDPAYPRLPLDEALALADSISLHTPLTPETRHLFDANRLAQIKPGARLVNVARGAVVDDTAIADALRTGRLAGYAADVITTEPPAPFNPLLTAPNCVLTPHLAWTSRDARERLLATSIENLRRFLGGAPQNVVSP